MPRIKDIKKVLVIGSGPIIIGQAAEFDYAGTRACRSLKEEGLEVVLLNSNPATIMTDKDIADRVYIEPLTVEVVEQLILKEKPDSVLPTLGGQAALNLAMELDENGFLERNNVRLIGTTSETIKKAEDRLEFKMTMEKIGEPCAASKVVKDVQAGIEFALVEERVVNDHHHRDDDHNDQNQEGKHGQHRIEAEMFPVHARHIAAGAALGAHHAFASSS